MKKLFDLGIGYDEDSGQYFALVNSITDHKTLTVRDKNLRVVMSKLSKMIRKKANDIQCFPLEKPEPSRIVQLNGNGTIVNKRVAGRAMIR